MKLLHDAAQLIDPILLLLLVVACEQPIETLGALGAVARHTELVLELTAFRVRDVGHLKEQ